MQEALRVLAATAVLAVLVAGCQKKQEDGSEQIEVGIVMKNYNSPYFQKLNDTIKAESEKLGWKCTILGSDSDVTKEAANIDSLIQKNVKVIFIDSIEPNPVVPAINRAVEAGIAVINVDSAPGAGSNDVTTVYSDNIENGRAVGKAYVTYVGMDKPLVGIILSGGKGNIAGLERRSGLFAGIIGARLGISDAEADAAAAEIEKQLVASGRAENAAAKFRIAGQGWGDWSRTGGLQVGEDLITANKDTLNLMMAENDEMNLGARQALVNAGLLDVDIIAAADGAQAAYDLIKSGEKPLYVATGENSPVKVGIKAVEIAKQIIIDGKSWTSFNKITKTDAFGVTADMVPDHYDYGF
ncbi:MAG: substrate-binding domain-containing protein [Spirochaetaceae bacterium]|nr:substrate-binding domain-containing protein [Spirochaetaceae bacterium]